MKSKICNSVVNLNDISQDILLCISDYLDIISICNLTINKEFNTLLLNKNKKNKRISFIYKNYPLTLIEAITIDRFLDIPVIDIGQRCGFTDYIDFIDYDDMIEDICIGVDIHKRGFISLIHKCGIMTLFQRYTDNKNYWTHGGVIPKSTYSTGGVNLSNPSWIEDHRFVILMENIKTK